jgi:hypothetical protein
MIFLDRFISKVERKFNKCFNLVKKWHMQLKLALTTLKN